MLHHETTRNGVILTSVILVLVLLGVTLVWLKSYFDVTANQEIHEKVLSRENAALQEQRAREAEVLGSYGWVDPEAGAVRIPIERAMKLVVEEDRERRGGE